MSCHVMSHIACDVLQHHIMQCSIADVKWDAISYEVAAAHSMMSCLLQGAIGVTCAPAQLLPAGTHQVDGYRPHLL